LAEDFTASLLLSASAKGALDGGRVVGDCRVRRLRHLDHALKIALKLLALEQPLGEEGVIADPL
jgi:hypothetical protein